MAPSASPGDRRPIASRNLRIWQRTAALLAHAGVSPNLISILGMLAAFAGAFALFCTSFTTGLSTRFHLPIPAACVALFVTYLRSLGKSLGVPGLFLASDDSSFITGIELTVDGGLAQV